MGEPILAVALGLTLWPAAAVTAVAGAPWIIADGAIQHLYNRHLQDAPAIVVLERSAANLYQTGRLALLCGKLVGCQMLQVASRQVDRQGGMDQIARDLGGFCVDRVVHP